MGPREANKQTHPKCFLNPSETAPISEPAFRASLSRERGNAKNGSLFPPGIVKYFLHRAKPPCCFGWVRERTSWCGLGEDCESTGGRVPEFVGARKHRKQQWRGSRFELVFSSEGARSQVQDACRARALPTLLAQLFRLPLLETCAAGRAPREVRGKRVWWVGGA